MRKKNIPLALVRSLPVQGALVGLAATQALDFISTYLYEKESVFSRAKENVTRGGLHAYERAIFNAARGLGISMSRREAKIWGWRLHKVFGIANGITYVAARRRNQNVGKWGGLAFGSMFFAIGDELLMPLLGYTPGPRRFSWRVHLRGAISHIAYGVAAELTARLIDRLTPKEDPRALAEAQTETDGDGTPDTWIDSPITTSESFSPRLA